MTEQLTLGLALNDDWPRTKAHRADPVTSHTAARKARGMVSEHQRIVLAALRRHPMTGGEVANVTPLDRYQVMRRMKELVDRGLVADSGVTRKTPAGRPAVVWRAK